MPKKIRELKAMLVKAGCISEPGKGSHTKWKHPAIERKIVLSGKDGADAKKYQEKADATDMSFYGISHAHQAEVIQLLQDIKKSQS